MSHIRFLPHRHGTGLEVCEICGARVLRREAVKEAGTGQSQALSKDEVSAAAYSLSKNPTVLDPQVISSLWPGCPRGGLQVKCNFPGVSLVALWWRILLPMQEMWVQPPIWEDPMPGASTQDPTHDKVMRRDLTGKADQDSRDSLDLLEHLPHTKICLVYCLLYYAFHQLFWH